MVSIYRRPAVLKGIRRDAHAVIEASAGTGKTYLIEHLIADLLLFTPCTIDQILVVTFTEKATAELRGRVRKLLENILRGGEGAALATDPHDEEMPLTEEHVGKLYAALCSFESAPIFTIHAFCQRVLTDYAFQSGTRFNPEVVDGKRAFHRAFRAELRRRAAEPSVGELLEKWLAEGSVDKLENLLFQAHRRRYLETPAPAPKTAGGCGSAGAQAAVFVEPGLEARLIDQLLIGVTERLDAVKREQGAIDYDDMLDWTWRALEGTGGNAMLSALRERFRYGLVDEFQDTDDLQWRIVRRLFVESGGRNLLYVVGDPKQAIYSFRGADVHTYLAAREELDRAGTSFLPLVKNFRSTTGLIEACNLVFDQAAPAPLFTGEIKYDHPVRCGRPDRRALGADGRLIVPVTLMRYEPPDGRRGSAAEARTAMGRHIAATLRRLLGEEPQIRIEEQNKEPRPIRASDIFVLTRTRNESKEIGKYLREAGVPFAFYKLDGLFQTGEAYHVLDVLRAVEQPHVRSRRLKAWASPFFGVPFRDLSLLGEVPSTHSLNERLDEWRALAEEEQFAELFDRLLHESGLVERELFLSDSERELTNYLHIFELLLQAAVSRRLSLSEIIALLEDYIAERASPPGMEGNVQRLESERAAVQVMTVHMAKGLETDVVVLYGGTHRSRNGQDFAVYHEGDERRFALGKDAIKAVNGRLLGEEREENERLLYVALTRARAKLYLPLFPKGSMSTRLNGYYTALNDRLNDIASVLNAGKPSPAHRPELFQFESVRDDTDEGGPVTSRSARPLSEWEPPETLLAEPMEPAFASLRRAHAPLVLRSYTSLKKSEGVAECDVAPDAFKGDLEIAAEGADLLGGREVGLFLHEVIERLDFGFFGLSPDLTEWKKKDEIKHLFHDAMRRRNVRDPRWFDRGCEAVFNTLTAPIAIGSGRMIGPLSACRSQREMEFVYPIPESGHPMLANPHDGAWTVRHGYLKGFVDFVLEHQGLVYFADWKSDLLPSYDSRTIKEHVKRNYELQAQIYSVGVIRLLHVTSEAEYERRFGGLLYIFLRGMRPDAGGDGVYFHRPRWAEICRYEAELMKVAPPLS